MTSVTTSPTLANIQKREDTFRRALQSIENVTLQKEQGISQKAKDIAAGAGESDLRRLKRQFASLKNTYMLYDTKEHFLDGLLDGLPDGQEEESLRELEERVKEQGARVKESKASTAEMQEQITALISKAAEVHDELDRERAAAQSGLDSLAASSAAMHSVAQQALPELLKGPQEEECTEALAREAAQGRQLEASIASDEAQAAELAAAIKAQEAELQLLQAQLDEAEASKNTAQQAEEVVQASRYGATVGWCQDVQGVLAALSGVTVLRFEEDCITVRLRTSFHTTWEPTGDAVETAEHELTLALASGSASLAGAELAPADVDISDIAQAAQRGCGGFEFVVREVHARLATRMRRAALIKEAQALCKLQLLDPESESLHATLGRSGAEAELVVPLQWPAKGVPLQLKAISTVQGEADLLQAMSLLQRQPELAYSSIASFLQAIDEAVSALLHSAGAKE